MIPAIESGIPCTGFDESNFAKDNMFDHGLPDLIWTYSSLRERNSFHPALAYMKYPHALTGEVAKDPKKVRFSFIRIRYIRPLSIYGSTLQLFKKCS